MNKSLCLAMLVSLGMVSPAWADMESAVRAFENGNYELAYPELKALSEGGNATAAYYVGRMYQEGLGVDADSELALRYFEAADSAHNPDAAVYLGKMALNGEGTTQDTDLGMRYLKKAAYAGSIDALYELGELYEDGIAVEKNYTYAFGFYYMAALRGDKRAQLKVGQFYLTGRGIPQDYQSALRWHVRSANQGYVPAQQEWAEIRSSHARLKNLLDAYSWYSILAAYNSDEVGVDAASKRDELAKKFESPVLTAQQKKIMNWRPVSAADSVPAQERMEAIQPIIPGFNDEETMKSRLESGEALNVDGSAYGIDGSMIELAVVSNNKSQLEDAVETAANNGQIKVYGYYGDVLRSRFKDEDAAVIWYQKGAEAGEPYAQFQLGKAYCEGRGVASPNIGTCYGWMLLSAKAPDNGAISMVRDAIASIEAAALPEELEAGKKMAEEQTHKAEEKAEKQPKKSPGLFNF